MLWWNQIRKSKLLLILIISLASLWSVWPLFHSGFFVSDDGEWMIIRFSAFHQALQDGQFPVRWLGRLNHEYGYPVSNFLYPGFMYLAEIPKILGFSFVSSIKIILGLSLVFSGVFSYFWLAKIFGRLPSFIGTLFYVYAPYHLYDVYTRGSVGEVLALAIIPFILWQIERKSRFWSTLGIGLLIISHNTLALLFLPLIILYLLLDVFTIEKKKRLHALCSLVLILVLSLGLSTFFWLPSIFDLRYTAFSQTLVSRWQDYFVDLPLVGWGTLVVFILFLIRFLLRKKTYFYSNDSNHSIKLSLIFFVVGLGAIFLSLSQSSFLWKILPVGFIQFPFRFLSITILSAAYLTAYLLSGFKGKKKWGVGAILLVVFLFSTFHYTQPSEFFDKGEGFYTTNEGTTTVQNEYMPRWVKTFPTDRPRQKVELIWGKGEISQLLASSRKINFEVNLKDNSLVQVNTLYFPGWRVWVDGGRAPINYENDQGVIQIPVLKGEHQVLMKFGETPLRLISDIISLISLLILGILTIKKPFTLVR